jgi:hypothetical protein
MTGQLSPLAQGKAAGAVAPYGSLLLATGATVQYDSELDDGYYEKGVVKSYSVTVSGTTTNVDLTHLISETGAFTAADKTYTDAGKCGVFKAAGGETIVISGSASNNGVFTTASATANTVVFVEAIADEADAPATTFKKREVISNDTVLDNNTGLTWLRNDSYKLGILGTGVMPYTGQEYDIFAYCAAANAASLGGQTDWRIPNVFELLSLVDYAATSSRPDTTAFPKVSYSAPHWSSNSKVTATTNAYQVDFYEGNVTTLAKTNARFCLLVRGG